MSQYVGADVEWDFVGREHFTEPQVELLGTQERDQTVMDQFDQGVAQGLNIGHVDNSPEYWDGSSSGSFTHSHIAKNNSHLAGLEEYGALVTSGCSSDPGMGACAAEYGDGGYGKEADIGDATADVQSYRQGYQEPDNGLGLDSANSAFHGVRLYESEDLEWQGGVDIPGFRDENGGLEEGRDLPCVADGSREFKNCEKQQRKNFGCSEANRQAPDVGSNQRSPLRMDVTIEKSPSRISFPRITSQYMPVPVPVPNYSQMHNGDGYGVSVSQTTPSADHAAGMTRRGSSTVSRASASQSDRLPCNRCTKTFMREGDLRRHYKKHFPSQRIFHCFVGGCGRNGAKGFYRRDKLANHQRNRH